MATLEQWAGIEPLVFSMSRDIFVTTEKWAAEHGMIPGLIGSIAIESSLVIAWSRAVMKRCGYTVENQDALVRDLILTSLEVIRKHSHGPSGLDAGGGDGVRAAG